MLTKPEIVLLLGGGWFSVVPQPSEIYAALQGLRNGHKHAQPESPLVLSLLSPNRLVIKSVALRRQVPERHGVSFTLSRYSEAVMHQHAMQQLRFC